VSAYKFGNSGSNLTKVYHATYREDGNGGVIIWGTTFGRSA